MFPNEYHKTSMDKLMIFLKDGNKLMFTDIQNFVIVDEPEPMICFEEDHEDTIYRFIRLAEVSNFYTVKKKQERSK